MGQSLREVGGHFQVALPWRQGCLHLPNNRIMVEQRLQLLKKWLLKGMDLLEKYRTMMEEYIVKGHAQNIPTDELNMKQRLTL